MAAIGRIRKHSGLLVGIIALSIIGFLIMDATNSQTGVLRGRKDSVGSIDGQKIHYNDFNNLYEKNEKAMQDMMGKGASLSDDQRNYIRQNTWDELIKKSVSENIAKEDGLTVSDDEMVELTTGRTNPNNAHRIIKQNFGGEQFNPMYVTNFLQNIDVDEKNMEPGYKRRVWNSLNSQIKADQINQKYASLISKGLGTPTWQAERTYQDGNRTADFKYVLFPYTEINDADIKVADSDLKAYLNEHAARFKQDEETRKIQYVAFDILPSAQDSAAALKYLETNYEQFKTGATKSADSAFLKDFSESYFDDVYYSKQQLAGNAVADTLLGRAVGSVIGPYVENGMYKVAKVSGRKMLSDSVRIREITFSFNNIQNEAQQKTRFQLVDSVFRAIDSFHTDFATLANQYTDNPKGKGNGGNVGWIKFGQYSGEEEAINRLLFYQAEPGKTYRSIFPSENAIKIFQVVEEKPTKPGVQIAYFTKSILPSAETEKNIYAEASNFASKYTDETKFKEAAKKYQIKTIEAIKKEEFSIMGLGNARDIIKWAFSAERGAVSPIKSIDKKHVIAYLESVRPKGTPDLDAVKEQVKSFYIKDKKVEMLSKKASDAKVNNIDDLAAKTGKQATLAEKALYANPMMPSGGYEPNVVAAGIYAAVNKLSSPVQGNQGVYVVQKVSGNEPPKATELSMYVMQLKQANMQKATRSAFEALKKTISVTDDRSEFF